MNWIDLIVLIIAIIGVIIGIYRGFLKSLTKLFNASVKLFLSALLCKPIAKLFVGSKIGEHMFDKIYGSISVKSELFNINLVGMDQSALNATIDGALSESGLSNFLKNICKNLLNVSPENFTNASSVTLADIVSNSLTNLIFIIISFILVLIVLSIIIWLLNKLSKKILSSTIILAKTDRILGGIVGLIKSFVSLTIIFIVLYFFRNVGFLQNLYISINNSLFGNLLYTMVTNFITNYINIKQMLIDWINTR